MKNIYAIKDNKLGFEQVLIAPNNASAIRMFGDSCRDENCLFALHPEDFDLYKIGEMDENTGTLKSDVQFLEKALTFSKKSKAA